MFVPKQYDCLGCPVCYPAIAANAFVEAYPDVGPDLISALLTNRTSVQVGRLCPEISMSFVPALR